MRSPRPASIAPTSSRHHAAARKTPARIAIVAISIVALFAVLLQFGGTSAEAAGPPYSGPQTEATGPAYFGPAPNVSPYCDNPTYFDPFPENVNPIGRIDVDGAPNASVTTDGITMTFELTAEGAPDTQYPGFFPEGADGGAGDQPKGVEMASDDAASILLSEPLFYTQWVFTDVDRANEGFDVTPLWTDPATPGQVGVFGGDANFDFAGTTTGVAQFNDTDQAGQPSESINGRVQVDFLGAVTGIDIVRDTGSGQSGFAVGGGCSPLGVAKELTSGPTWNGSSFDVTYTLRVRNNLPSTATLAADVNAALAAAASGTSAGTPTGIDMTNIQLSDILADAAFGTVEVISNTNTGDNIEENLNYDGVNDTNLIADGEVIAPETEEEFVLVLQYTPEAAGPLGDTCAVSYDLLNSAVASGTASGVTVSDLSDEGVDPDPGVDNGDGGNDDPTVVTFDCPPVVLDPVLEIVKTVVEGPNGTCPDFAGGVADDGDALNVDAGDTVTYCISVRNTGQGDATNVVVSDPMAPAAFDGAIGALAAGTEAAALSFDLVVDAQTPPQNTASVAGTGPNGDVGPVLDTALIEVAEPLTASIAISKTVVADGVSCGTAVEGVDEFVVGLADAAITWCFTILNDGETPLTNIVLDDSLAGLNAVDVLATYAGGAASLAVGDTISFELAATIPAAGAVNSVDVSADPSDAAGTPIVGATPVADNNDAEVGSTGVTLAKTVIAGPAGDCAAAVELVTVEPGSTVTYCFVVTNTGSVALEVVEVVDADLGVNVPVPAPDQIIAAGASITVSTDVTAMSLVNTASVTGTPVDPAGNPIPGAPTPTDNDDAEVIEQGAPILGIVKTVVAGPNGTCPANAAAGVVGDGTALDVNIGDTVTYCLNVTNTGNEDATDVVVTDPMAPAGFNGALGTIAIGAEASTSFDLVVASDTATTNTATVSGNGPGGAVPTATDTAVIDPAPPVPSVALIKTVVAAGGDCAAAQEGVDELVVANIGDAITWCFVVTNDGNVPLANVVFDDGPANLTGVDVLATYGGGASLAVGASISFEVDGVIPVGGIDNVATVSGEASELDGTLLAGIDPVDDENEAAIDALDADLSIDKAVSNAGPVFADTVVTYTLVVANAGPGTAQNVSLVDTLPAGLTVVELPATDGWACSLVGTSSIECARALAMENGASDTLTYTVRVTAAAAGDVDLVNTAQVTSSTPDPDPTNNEDTDITSRLVPVVTPITPIEYPGPFTPPEPAPVPAPAPPLAHTGSETSVLTASAMTLLLVGGALAVGSRRRQDDFS